MGNSVLTAVRESATPIKPVIFAKGRFRLHAMVSSAGYEECHDPTYSWHGLQRGSAEFALLQHTLSGRGHVRVDTRTRTALPGTTMLLTFPYDNHYWLAAGDRWEFFWICLHGREVMRVWRQAMALHGPILRFTPTAVDAFAASCLAVLDGNADSAGAASALAYAVAMQVFDEIATDGDHLAGANRPDAVTKAVDFCRAHLDQPLDVNRLAAVAGYSRHHLTRLFIASEGVGPAEFIMRERMKKAVQLLHHTHQPIKSVSRQCGFADPNYFAKTFRRAFGVSPTDFRRSGMFGAGLAH